MPTVPRSIKLDIRLDITPEGVETLVFSAYSPEEEFKELVKTVVTKLAEEHYLSKGSKLP